MSVKNKVLSAMMAGVLAVGLCPATALADDAGSVLAAGSIGKVAMEQVSASEAATLFFVDRADVVYYSSTTAYEPKINVELITEDYETVDVTLVKGADYTVSYEWLNDDYDYESVSGVTVAGRYKVIVTGVGSYADKSEYTYIDVYDSNDIAAASRVDHAAWCFESSTAYTLPFELAMGTADSDTGGASLAEDIDYTVSYVYWDTDLDQETAVSGLSKVGTYEVTFTGKGQYKGTKTDLVYVGKLTVQGNGDQMYTGKAITPVLTIGWTDGDTSNVLDSDDYTLTYANNTNVGTATVTITGKDFYVGTATTTFKIVPATSIASKKLVLSKSSFTYNGKVQKPTVKTVDGKALKSGTDYTINYSNANSAKVGSYTVTVTGKGSYTGTSASATYKIVKAANPLTAKGKSTSVKYNKKKTATVAASKVLKVSKAQGKVTYEKVAKGSSKYLSVNKSTGKVTVAKGAPKGKQVIKVSVKAAGNANYKAASKTVKVTVTLK